MSWVAWFPIGIAIALILVLILWCVEDIIVDNVKWVYRKLRGRK